MFLVQNIHYVFDGIQSLRSVGGATWTGNVCKLLSVLRNQNNLADCTGDSKKAN